MIDRLRALPAWLRCSLALLAGVPAAFGFAPHGWWPLTIGSVAALSLLSLTAPRARVALLTGYCWGLGFLGPALRWMSVIFVEAMLGLVAMEALFFAALGLGLWLTRHRRAWPLIAAGLWLGAEFSYARVPFEGFGWMRLAYAMIDTPLAGFLPLVGVPGVSLLTALVAQLPAWWLRARPSLRSGGLVAGGVALLLAVGAVATTWTPPAGTESVRVGYVQGNAPGGGIYGLGEARTITRNHVAETARLMAAVNAGSLPRPDFVVWPENGTDVDPFLDATTASLVRQARDVVGVPLLIGSITDGPGANERQTAALWYDPTLGVTARYNKRNIVPFGEWVPYRSILEPLFPVVRYVGPQSVPGTVPGVLRVQVADQPLAVGDLICFEVAFDATVRDTVTSGAEVLLVQSSNAMYTGTDQVHQQFAITRARAAELRREILVVTTTGISGLIRPDGSVALRLPEHVPASGVVALPRRTTLTPAVTLSAGLELAVLLTTVAALAWPIVRRSGRGRRTGLVAAVRQNGETHRLPEDT